MRNGTSKLTPEIIRALADGTGINHLIGKWVAFESPVFKGKRFILTIEIVTQNEEPVVGFMLINKRQFDRVRESQPVDSEGVLNCDLLQFDTEENKGYLRTDNGQTLAFSKIDQTETPQILREQITLLEQYPLGATIDIPGVYVDMRDSPIPFKEAIISGCAISKNAFSTDEVWLGVTIVRDGLHPNEEFLIPAPLLKVAGVEITPHPESRAEDSEKPAPKPR